MRWRDPGYRNPYEGRVGYSWYDEGYDAAIEAIWKLAEASPTKTFCFDARKDIHTYPSFLAVLTGGIRPDDPPEVDNG